MCYSAWTVIWVISREKGIHPDLGLRIFFLLFVTCFFFFFFFFFLMMYLFYINSINLSHLLRFIAFLLSSQSTWFAKNSYIIGKAWPESKNAWMNAWMNKQKKKICSKIKRKKIIQKKFLTQSHIRVRSPRSHLFQIPWKYLINVSYTSVVQAWAKCPKVEIWASLLRIGQWHQI